MGTNKSALIHAGLAHRTGVLSRPQNRQLPFVALTHTLTCAAAVTWTVICQLSTQQSADGAVGLGGLQSECVHGESDAQNCLSGLVVGRGRVPLWSFVRYPDLDQTLGGHAAVVSSGLTFISESRELLRLISCGRGGATVQHNTKQSATARLATHSNNKHRTESQMSLNHTVSKRMI